MDEDIPIDNIDPSSFGNDIDIKQLLETISENDDVEVVDSVSMRPSVYPDLLSSAVRQSGINGFGESREMSRSMHQQESEDVAYLGGYTPESATSMPRMAMRGSAPSSRAPSSAPGAAPGCSPMQEQCLVSREPSMSPPPSSRETKRLSKPLVRMSVPAPPPPRLEASIKTESYEEKESYSSGRSLMFPMGRMQKVSQWKQELDQSEMCSEEMEDEFADIRSRSVVKNDVMLSDGARVESVAKGRSFQSMNARRVEVKLEEVDTGEEGEEGLECASLAVEHIKEEDEDEELNEKARPSVLELAEMFASQEDGVIKKEEVYDEVKTDSIMLGGSSVQDVKEDKIDEKIKVTMPTPVLATSLGSLENMECFDAPRGQRRGRSCRSSTNECASIPGIISSWLGDLFPALLYLLTPFLVIFLAFLVQFLWTTFTPNVQQ